MKANLSIVAATVVALFTAGASATYLGRTSPAVGPLSGLQADEGVPQNLITAMQFDEGVPQNLVTAMKFDEGVPQNLVTAMKFDEGVPQNLVTA